MTRNAENVLKQIQVYLLASYSGKTSQADCKVSSSHLADKRACSANQRVTFSVYGNGDILKEYETKENESHFKCILLL